MRPQATDLNNRRGTELAVNKFVYAAAGGIVIAAIAVFFLLGQGLTLPGQQERPEVRFIPPVLTVRDISVTSVEEENAQVQVTFHVSNPNQRPLYMEAIHYDLYINGKQMALGQWGDIAEGFLTGSTGIIVVSEGSSSIPPVTTPVPRNNQVADEWDSMVDGAADYTIRGTYAYRLTQANFQTTAEEQSFELTFP